MVGRLESIDLSLPAMSWAVLRPTETRYERLTLKVQPRLR